MMTSPAPSRSSMVRLKNQNYSYYLTLVEKFCGDHLKSERCPSYTYPSPWIYVANRHTSKVPLAIAPSEDVWGLNTTNGVPSLIKPLSFFFLSGVFFFLNFGLQEFHRWYRIELLCICKCALASQMMLLVDSTMAFTMAYWEGLVKK